MPVAKVAETITLDALAVRDLLSDVLRETETAATTFVRSDVPVVRTPTPPAIFEPDYEFEAYRSQEIRYRQEHEYYESGRRGGRSYAREMAFRDGFIPSPFDLAPMERDPYRMNTRTRCRICGDPRCRCPDREPY